MKLIGKENKQNSRGPGNGVLTNVHVKEAIKGIGVCHVLVTEGTWEQAEKQSDGGCATGAWRGREGR